MKNYMKTLITLGGALLGLTGALLGNYSRNAKNFSIENPQKMTVTSISGEQTDVTDEDLIQKITDNITSVKFKKGQSSLDTNGFGPIISWYNSNGDVIETISIMNNDTIIYNNYFWKAINGSVDDETINTLLSDSSKYTKLTLGKVKELAAKGMELSWSDFERYHHEDIGSGLYIRAYDIDENYCLLIGGGDIQEPPMYMRLVSKTDDSVYIDIRTENVDNFINSFYQ